MPNEPPAPPPPPEGWYPDSSGRMRKWDGAAWTDEYQEPVSAYVEPPPHVSNETPVGEARSHPEPNSQTRRRWYKKKRVIVSGIAFMATIAAVAIFLVVTAGPSADEKRAIAEANASAAAQTAADDAAAEIAQLQEACQSTLADFKTAVEAVNSKLSVGLSQSDFNTALGDSRIAYDQIDSGAIDSDAYCLEKVWKPLEDAFNIYVDSNQVWQKCIQAYSCEVKGKVLKGLQAKWSKAEVQILVADTMLTNYDPAGSS